MLRGRPLAEAVVRAAEHRHLAVAVRLRRQPLDDVVAVAPVVLARAEHALGVAAPARVDQQRRVAVGREVRRPRVVAVRVVRRLHEHHRPRRVGERPIQRRAERDPVAHRDAHAELVAVVGRRRGGRAREGRRRERGRRRRGVGRVGRVRRVRRVGDRDRGRGRRRQRRAGRCGVRRRRAARRREHPGEHDPGNPCAGRGEGRREGGERASTYLSHRRGVSTAAAAGCVIRRRRRGRARRPRRASARSRRRWAARTPRPPRGSATP